MSIVTIWSVSPNLVTFMFFLYLFTANFMLYNMFVLNDTYMASSNVEWPGAKIMLTLVMFSEPLKRCIATYMLLI